jgi:hypothetical protein
MARVPFSTALTGTLEDAGADLAADLRAAANIDTQIGTATQEALDGKAAKGANSDITSLSGLTTPLSVAQGGTSATTAAAAATSLGVGTGDSPQFTAVNIGHATDTTITRSSAGVIAVEGAVVMTRSASETITGLKTISRASATTNANYLLAVPTDAAVGKPQLFIQKNTAATQWDVGLTDGVNNAGTINFDVANLTHASRNVAVTNYTFLGSDASVTLAASARTVVHGGTLTAGRTLTLPSSAALGTEIKVMRYGAGAFNLSIGGLKNLTTNTWCIVVYNGSGWELWANGTLS